MPATRIPLIRRTSVILLLVPLIAGTLLQFHTLASSGPPPDQNTLPATAQAGPGVAQLSPAGALEQPAVEGWVTTAARGEPVAGAVVRTAGLATRSDSTGHFTFPTSELERATAGESSADVKAARTRGIELKLTVEADGFATWVISGARYFKGDTLRIYPTLPASGLPAVEVRAAEQHRGAVGTGETAVQTTTGSEPGLAALGPQSALPQSASAWTPPATIRVYRTQTAQVEVVPFRDYVKHVLPNEWIPTWHPEALRAGAMATKMYAWYWISQGGKQRALGADVKDNIDDQVYDPNVSYASTDSAVDATFNYAMTLNGDLFQTQYCAGSYGGDGSGDCPWSGLYMTQWGSAYYADNGRTWGWILQFYYTGAVITPNPPGGGYTGTPVRRATATTVPGPAPTAPVPGAPPGVGQGSDRPDLFQQAYARAGGAASLGVPTGPVRWWLTYVSEFNVVSQRFSGPDGRNNIWIVYDTLKAPSEGVHRAFVLKGDIAAEYASHTPPGPEWVGAPTSDEYTADPALGGGLTQGFTKGSLTSRSQGVVPFSPWPEQFGGWKAEYFPGYEPPSPGGGSPYSLSGQPSLVRDVPSPSFDLTAGPNLQAGYGVGKEDWSVQFSRDVQLNAGTYDFVASMDGGIRLWIDGVLGIDSWQPKQSLAQLSYSADLPAGSHRIRLQYFRLSGGGRLQFDMQPHGQPGSAPAPESQPTQAAAPAQKAPPSGPASLRVSAQWLGRGEAPSDRWQLPVVLQLSAPGNPAILATFRSNTDRNGVAFFSGLPAGVYDVHLKGPHSLQAARASVNLATGTANLDMKVQIEGDVDGDNCVTPEDLADVQALLGTSRGDQQYNSLMDLNGDGSVNLADVSLLRSGFDMCGDISADTDFQALSTSSSPSLSDTLSPWLRPSSLQHTLALAAVPSNPFARPGDVITLDVVALAGSQKVDGAAFVLHFDAQRLAPVDSGGNPTNKAEPGFLLPAVLGDWIDTKSGTVGYSGGMVQGTAPSGRVTVAKLRFRVLGSASAGVADFTFEPAGSPYMHITYGGENLLSVAQGASVNIGR